MASRSWPKSSRTRHNQKTTTLTNKERLSKESIEHLPVTETKGNGVLWLDLEKNQAFVGGTSSGKSRFVSRVLSKKKRFFNLTEGDGLWRTESTALMTLLDTFRTLLQHCEAFDYVSFLIGEYLSVKRVTNGNLVFSTQWDKEVTLRLEDDELVCDREGESSKACRDHPPPLSAGLSRMLRLVTSIWKCTQDSKNERSFFLIDEPFLKLQHHDWAEIWERVVKKEENCTFWFTSTCLVSTLDMMRKCDVSVHFIHDCRQTDKQGMVLNCCLMNARQNTPLYINAALGQAKCIVVCEGREDGLDARLYRALLKGHPLISSVRSAFHSNKGCHRVIDTVKMMNSAQEEHSGLPKFYGIIDGDFKGLIYRKVSASSNVFPLPVYSIESILLHPDVLKRVFDSTGNVEERLQQIYAAAKEAGSFQVVDSRDSKIPSGGRSISEWVLRRSVEANNDAMKLADEQELGTDILQDHIEETDAVRRSLDKETWGAQEYENALVAYPGHDLMRFFAKNHAELFKELTGKDDLAEMDLSNALLRFVENDSEVQRTLSASLFAYEPSSKTTPRAPFTTVLFGRSDPPGFRIDSLSKFVLSKLYGKKSAQEDDVGGENSVPSQPSFSFRSNKKVVGLWDRFLFRITDKKETDEFNYKIVEGNESIPPYVEFDRPFVSPAIASNLSDKGLKRIRTIGQMWPEIGDSSRIVANWPCIYEKCYREREKEELFHKFLWSLEYRCFAKWSSFDGKLDYRNKKAEVSRILGSQGTVTAFLTLVLKGLKTGPAVQNKMKWMKLKKLLMSDERRDLSEVDDRVLESLKNLVMRHETEEDAYKEMTSNRLQIFAKMMQEEPWIVSRVCPHKILELLHSQSSEDDFQGDDLVQNEVIDVVGFCLDINPECLFKIDADSAENADTRFHTEFMRLKALQNYPKTVGKWLKRTVDNPDTTQEVLARIQWEKFLRRLGSIVHIFPLALNAAVVREMIEQLLQCPRIGDDAVTTCAILGRMICALAMHHEEDQMVELEAKVNDVASRTHQKLQNQRKLTSVCSSILSVEFTPDVPGQVGFYFCCAVAEKLMPSSGATHLKPSFPSTSKIHLSQILFERVWLRQEWLKYDVVFHVPACNEVEIYDVEKKLKLETEINSFYARLTEMNIDCTTVGGTARLVSLFYQFPELLSPNYTFTARRRPYYPITRSCTYDQDLSLASWRRVTSTQPSWLHDAMYKTYSDGARHSESVVFTAPDGAKYRWFVPPTVSIPAFRWSSILDPNSIRACFLSIEVYEPEADEPEAMNVQISKY